MAGSEKQLGRQAANIAHLAPEKLSFVAGRIERQPLRSAGEARRGENVAKNATLVLRSMH